MKFKAVIAALAVVSSCALLTSRPVEVHAQATQLPLAKQCFQATAGINGMVGVLGTPTGGSGYVNGSYGGVALTGGSGLNATANITVSGGIVTAVAILNPGTEYVIGDVLSASAASIGGSGSGFSVAILSTSINSAVAGGSVAYYIPGTLNTKQTWQDAGETILNSQPVPLDQNGCAIVYGVGVYRQIVMDSLGNTIWDQVTTSNGGGGGSTGTPSSEGIMVGTIIPWANTTLPPHYLYTDGSTVSRTTYSQLLTAITFSTPIICQIGIATISVSAAISDAIPIGAPIEASCFAPGTVVSSKTVGALTMSNSATITTSVNAVLFPWGNGDGATTFTLPFFNGRTLVARNNAGTGTGPMSQTYYGTNPNAINAHSDMVGGSNNGSQTLVLGNLPPYTPAGGITNGQVLIGGSSTLSFSLTNGVTYAPNTGSSQGAANTSANITQNASSFAGTAQGGTSAPFSIVQPSVTVDYIIKALPDDSPTGPGVSSIGGMTGVIACGTGLVCNANTISVQTTLVVNVSSISGGTHNGILFTNTNDTVGNTNSANNGVLVTGSGGSPSVSTTLPNGLAMGTPASETLTNATGLPLTTGITGTLAPANGGTGATSLGSTLNNSGGVLNCTTGTTSQTGCLKPDGATITVVGGVITAPTGGAGNVVGSGSSTVGDIPQITNGGTTAISSTGYNGSQIPGLIPSTATVSISIASPAVVTWTAHGLTANAPVYFCTTGALPTGLTPCAPGLGGTMSPNSYESNPTLYYVIGSSITTNTFQVATSVANAKAGTAVNTTGSQSGTQTAFANSAACAGCIGEHIYVVVPPTGAGDVLCNNGSPDTVWASITLQPGVWKVWGSVGVFGSGTAVFSTNHSSYGVGITTICSTPYCGTTDWHLTSNNSNGVLFPYNASVIPVYAANTVVNAVSEPVWTGSGAIATCFGDLHAIRVH